MKVLQVCSAGLQSSAAGAALPPGRTLYAYASEHLPFWQTVRAQARVAGWGEPVPPGLFGEDLLLAGLREADLWVGDMLRLPQATLAVSGPRLPDAEFSARLGFAQAARLMQQSGFSGWHLVVIAPGTVQAGDAIELLPGPREVNLRELFRSRVA
jgi:MOSC domain-containing protein YiiM